MEQFDGRKKTPHPDPEAKARLWQLVQRECPDFDTTAAIEPEIAVKVRRHLLEHVKLQDGVLIYLGPCDFPDMAETLSPFEDPDAFERICAKLGVRHARAGGPPPKDAPPCYEL